MKKISKLFRIISYITTVIAIFLCLDKLLKSYQLTDSIQNNTVTYFESIKSFGEWNISYSYNYRYIPSFSLKEKGININSISVDRLNNKIISQFFISLHTPLLDEKQKDCYKDLYISLYYPYKKSLFDVFSLYYSIDNEEPILTKIRYDIVEDNVLKIYFRNNVYNFFRKCNNHKRITFYLQDFIHEIKPISFSLRGINDAYKYGLNLIYNQ